MQKTKELKELKELIELARRYLRQADCHVRHAEKHVQKMKLTVKQAQLIHPLELPT